MTGLLATIRREISRLCGRRIYFWTMIVVPVVCSLYFLSLLNEGLPLKSPAAIVDLDHTSMSRQATRSLQAMELIDIREKANSFHEAMAMVDRGEIYGFFYIPDGFQKDAISGRTPTLTYYSNMAYFVPGTLSFKGFKTLAVSTSGSIVKAELVSVGVGAGTADTILQPMAVQDHQIGNPWTNYSIYLSSSFLPGLVELMVMLVTAFSICREIKTGSSVEWLRVAGGSIWTAVVGKLIPQAVIFSVVGIFVQSLMFGYLHFPLNGSLWAMIAAMVLMVIASQWLAVLMCSAFVNLRMAVASSSLTGILAFSIAAFSFPVPSMYGAVGIFSYILPVRYYFLIYIDQALNGIPLFYSRWYYIALLLFPMLGGVMLWHLKKMCLKPVYVP